MTTRCRSARAPPCGLALGRPAPESPSDRLAPARYDASPDSATWDQPAPAAPRSAHPGDRLSCVATITSCPNSLSTRLIQGECVPISSAMRLRGIASKTSRNAFAVVRSRCSNWIWPASSNTQYQVLRSPKFRPVVSFGWKIFLLCLVARPFHSPLGSKGHVELISSVFDSYLDFDSYLERGDRTGAFGALTFLNLAIN